MAELEDIEAAGRPMPEVSVDVRYGEPGVPATVTVTFFVRPSADELARLVAQMLFRPARRPERIYPPSIPWHSAS